ncbi:MAG: redoxin domain-containing protein [Chloroflexi bacterium]|nr:redoxin domain-containing protein [Chloroflexota bacterium]MQC17156.1 peroxiredoxin [Chloroflexota bacterium]
MAIEAGSEAPDFTLTDENNQKVTLSELRGTPVVLVFYPFDFSGTCTAEHCDIRDNYGSWMEKGAKVYGISRDSRFTHNAFKEREGFQHSLLADLKGEVASQYGVWNAAAAAAERATFVIDREGTVAYAIYNAIPDARDHAEVEKHIA